MEHRIVGIFLVSCVLFSLAAAEAGNLARIKRQECRDPHFRYGSIDAPANTTVHVIAKCRYYGDRFYECTAWNRLLARNHWILSDGIIPPNMWVNKEEHVRIAECKFYDYEKQYRCRAACVAGTCGQTCPWGGRYEGTPQAGFRQAGPAYLDNSQPVETYTVVAPSGYTNTYDSNPNIVRYRQV